MTPSKTAQKSKSASAAEKASAKEDKATVSYSVEDLLDHLPAPIQTVGNRDGKYNEVNPEETVKGWLEHRDGAEAIVAKIMAAYPEDPDNAAQTLTIVATYETGDVSSWSDAAQAARIAQVAKKSGPSAARARYEKVVPAVNGSINTATKIGKHHREKYAASLPATETADSKG